ENDLIFRVEQILLNLHLSILRPLATNSFFKMASGEVGKKLSESPDLKCLDAEIGWSVISDKHIFAVLSLHLARKRAIFIGNLQVESIQKDSR
ncbi:hypothetical protein CEXT_562391, partial [Caerostris extrusa]